MHAKARTVETCRDGSGLPRTPNRRKFELKLVAIVDRAGYLIKGIFKKQFENRVSSAKPAAF